MALPGSISVAVHTNGHIIGRSAQGRGYSRRVDALQAAATLTGTRAVPGALLGYDRNAAPVRVEVREVEK